MQFSATLSQSENSLIIAVLTDERRPIKVQKKSESSTKRDKVNKACTMAHRWPIWYDRDSVRDEDWRISVLKTRPARSRIEDLILLDGTYVLNRSKSNQNCIRKFFTFQEHFSQSKQKYKLTEWLWSALYFSMQWIHMKSCFEF